MSPFAHSHPAARYLGRVATLRLACVVAAAFTAVVLTSCSASAGSTEATAPASLGLPQAQATAPTRLPMAPRAAGQVEIDRARQMLQRLNSSAATAAPSRSDAAPPVLAPPGATPNGPATGSLMEAGAHATLDGAPLTTGDVTLVPVLYFPPGEAEQKLWVATATHGSTEYIVGTFAR